MPLPFFKQQLNDVDGQLRRFRQRDTFEWRNSRRRLPDSQRRLSPHRDDLRDGCLTIKDCYGLAASHGPEILAEFGF